MNVYLYLSTNVGENAMPEQPRKLLDVVRDVLRTKHYSYRTKLTYVDWIKRYILFHQKRHPKDMGEDETPS